MKTAPFILKPLAFTAACAAQLCLATPTTSEPSTTAPIEQSSPTVATVNSQNTRTYDGSQNNIAHPEYGKTNIQLRRLDGLPAFYGDGIEEPIGFKLNARAISNFVFKQSESTPEPNHATHYLWAWGQLLDHDIDLTPENEEEDLVINNPGDEDGIEHIALHRSSAAPGTGTTSPREQLNIITGWIDGSMVYGSDAKTAARLRSFENGKLKINTEFSDKGKSFLPQEGSGANANFFAGDVRVNEHVILSTMHTLLLREHNRHADEYLKDNPSASDEEVYQHCRKMVIAIIQHITFSEFLPLLLGADAIPAYTGYNSDIRPDISNSFATAAYRFGHSAVKSTIPRVNADGSAHTAGHLTLGLAFFTPATLKNSANGGLDPIYRGLASERTEQVDSKIIDDLRVILFGNQDLAARNIARGRDHGLRTFNDVRRALKLQPYSSFEEINEDPAVQNALRSAYDTPDDIELWVGGLSERRQPTGLLGEVFQIILKDQFIRLRDGDRFWYENTSDSSNPDHLTETELAAVKDTTLKKIIVRNSGIENSELADNVFIAPEAQAQEGDSAEVQRLLGRIEVREMKRSEQAAKSLSRQELLASGLRNKYQELTERHNNIRRKDYLKANEAINRLALRILQERNSTTTN